ncbi:DUF4105 domain-containing protein [Halobacteriovorax sp. HLS]|uniref:DUF7844 domain-containing protein n=1 Tax=Halobacteriovorax sp. HLS TaxID=2234000 RepID=UPI000FDC524D|nr:DUF4105 domain-containing protein [Halobacteriovorax sp. HLS]
MALKLFITLMMLISTSAFANSKQSKFVVKTYELLPASVKKVITLENTPIKFTKLNSVGLNSPCDDIPFIFGKHSDGKIYLSEQLNPYLLASEQEDFKCKHKSFYKTAVSTLLHEFIHAYENKVSDRDLLHNKAEFKALGFWKLKSKKTKNLNTYSQRSPNKYEYSSLKEFIAVNFEYFILDKEYKCRRPNLYSAFSRNLNHIPFNNHVCKSLREVSFSDTHKVGSIDINFDNIREIHYLFASKGKAMMSRWGHSMFKLVSCPLDWSLEKCRKRGTFTVIGFLAQVSDVNINAIKGIRGDYPSDLVITDLDSMKRQYNRAELRDLMSLPIKFTSLQKERFLNHLIRVYWEYSGRYYFFTNNCADEAFKFLQVSYNDDEIYKKRVLTPLGILNFVKKNNIIFDYKFDETKVNISKGLLYESFKSKLDRSYKALYSNYKDVLKIRIKRPSVNRNQRKFAPEFSYIDSIEKYTNLDTWKRREFIEEILKTAKKKSILNLFAVESQAHYVTGNLLLNSMQSKSQKMSDIEDAKEIFPKIVELKNTIIFGTNSNNSGYGIPQEGDLTQVVSDDSYYAQEELAQLKKDLQSIYKEVFQDEFSQLEESNINKLIIKKALKNVL